MINALGTDLGPLVGPSHVLLTLPDGRRSYAEVNRDGAPVDWQMIVFYESAACDSEPFVSWNFVEELVPPTLVRPWGAWAIRPGTTQMRTVKGSKTFDASGLSPVCKAENRMTFTSAFDFYTLDQLNLFAPLAVN